MMDLSHGLGDNGTFEDSVFFISTTNRWPGELHTRKHTQFKAYPPNSQVTRWHSTNNP